MASRTARTAMFLAATSLAACAKPHVHRAPEAPAMEKAPEPKRDPYAPMDIFLVAVNCGGEGSTDETGVNKGYKGGAYGLFEPTGGELIARAASADGANYSDAMGAECIFMTSIVTIDPMTSKLIGRPELVENGALSLECGTLREIAAETKPQEPLTGPLTVRPHPDGMPGKKLATSASGSFSKTVHPGQVCIVRQGIGPSPVAAATSPFAP